MGTISLSIQIRRSVRGGCLFLYTVQLQKFLSQMFSETKIFSKDLQIHEKHLQRIFCKLFWIRLKRQRRWWRWLSTSNSTRSRVSLTEKNVSHIFNLIQFLFCMELYLKNFRKYHLKRRHSQSFVEHMGKNSRRSEDCVGKAETQHCHMHASLEMWSY